MKKISLNLPKLENKLITLLGHKYMDEVNNIKIKDLLPLVYTSFDGDHLSQSERMKQFAFKQGFIPLNPESALGTYLVTNHYMGEKHQIIIDCLKLLSMCDVFWVMSEFRPKNSTDIAKLSEGVIAEILYWCKYKNPQISVVDIVNYQLINHIRIPTYILEYLHPLQKRGIEEILKINLPKLRNTVYLCAGEKHAKHSDWLRKDAYNNNKVPLCPYTLYNKGTLDLAYNHNELDKLLARVTLSMKADEIWIYGIYECHDVDLLKLEPDLLLELYLTLKFKKMKIIYKFFGEINVPKYTNRKQWAITEYEKIYQT